jgi:mannose-6-phosphate isomerase-like protein (cupin superfamily)
VLRDRAAAGELLDDDARATPRGSVQTPDRIGGPMSQDTQTLAPMVTRRGDGEARWWFSALAEIKVTAEETGGLMSIGEMTEPPNAAEPLHVHHREDEGFWILEGDVTLEVGDTTIEAHAGDFAFGPRGIPHRYTVGDAGCRMLFILTPGGFEDLVREMSVPAARRTLPPASEDEPDWERVAAIARAHHCELLG